MKAFFLCGPHCVGKTTILKRLYEEGHTDFYGHEIGKALFYERKFHPGRQMEDFEVEVAKKELDRDCDLFKKAGWAGIETWHPGNLAYALVRNPAMQGKLVEIALQSPLLRGCRGIWLRIPRSEIVKRTVTFRENPEWAGDFYEAIDSKIDNCLKQLGLADNVEVIDASGELAETYYLVKDSLGRAKESRASADGLSVHLTNPDTISNARR